MNIKKEILAKFIENNLGGTAECLKIRGRVASFVVDGHNYTWLLDPRSRAAVDSGTFVYGANAQADLAAVAASDWLIFDRGDAASKMLLATSCGRRLSGFDENGENVIIYFIDKK